MTGEKKQQLKLQASRREEKEKKAWWYHVTAQAVVDEVSGHVARQHVQQDAPVVVL